jgi:hypothetical protein
MVVSCRLSWPILSFVFYQATLRLFLDSLQRIDFAAGQRSPTEWPSSRALEMEHKV